MSTVLAEIQGWLAFLDRLPVLLQLLPVGLLLLSLLRLRRQPVRGRWSWLWKLPLVVPLLGGQGLIALVLLALHQRVGLVLLLGQFSLAWLLLLLGCTACTGDFSGHPQEPVECADPVLAETVGAPAETLAAEMLAAEMLAAAPSGSPR
jgi:hypothetical protein